MTAVKLKDIKGVILKYRDVKRSFPTYHDKGFNEALSQMWLFLKKEGLLEVKKMTCNCKEWQENIDKINAPMILQAARSGGRYQYDGINYFKYCPWCSKKLLEEVKNG